MNKQEISAGYVMVPVELLTEEMPTFHDDDADRKCFALGWNGLRKELLAAAPKAEQDHEGPSDAARYGLLRAMFDGCKSSQCELMQYFLRLDGEPHETLDTLIDRALLGGLITSQPTEKILWYTGNTADPTDAVEVVGYLYAAQPQSDEFWAEKLADNSELRRLCAERDQLRTTNQRLREALADLLESPASVVQATVPRAGIEMAPPYQVVLDVSVSLTRWRKAQAALLGVRANEESEAN